MNLENYRPISILPILLKLFSRVLCARIANILSKAQTLDQAGFRPGYSCDDHLFALTMLYEKKVRGMAKAFMGSSHRLQEGVRHGRTCRDLGIIRSAGSAHPVYHNFEGHV